MGLNKAVASERIRHEVTQPQRRNRRLRPARRDGKTITQAFEDFHAQNPRVLEELATYARTVKARGKRCGIAMLYERLRYERLITEGDDFKLNNNYRALYARLLMAQYPDLDGFFTTRERTAA